MPSPTDVRPPFTEETARAKVQAAQDAWNSRDPERVSLAYTEDSVWRNRDTLLTGRSAIMDFLTAKWQRTGELVQARHDAEQANRDEFFSGREAIRAFLKRKWARELDYKLRKELWAFTDDRIAVRFEYESRDAGGQWWRSYGNEMWEFSPDGLMRRRYASINDAPIEASERRID